MRIDVHVHLSSPEILSDRDKAFYGEPSVWPLYKDPRARIASVDDLLLSMEKYKVDKALVMGFAFMDEDKIRRYNDWLLEECLHKHKDRLYPLCAFDPRVNSSLKIAEEFLDMGGFGLGELCVYEEGIKGKLLDNLEALCQLVKEKDDRVILIHVNEPIGHSYPGKAPIETSEIYNLIKRSHDSKLILAHFGGGIPLLSVLKKEVKDNLMKVRFDTAAMPFVYSPDSIRIASGLLGPEAILYGSDFPLLDVPRYESYLSGAKLPEDQERLIMGENAASFLGLS
jgi:predicted TIM-barrel fold metal-dependent hydrolase